MTTMTLSEQTILMPEAYVPFGQSSLETEEPQYPEHLTCPQKREGILLAHSIHLCTVDFKEGVPAYVFASATEDVDIYVYDRFGILIAYDTTEGPTPFCKLTPMGSGECLIKLVNNAPGMAEFVLHIL